MKLSISALALAAASVSAQTSVLSSVVSSVVQSTSVVSSAVSSAVASAAPSASASVAPQPQPVLANFTCSPGSFVVYGNNTYPLAGTVAQATRFFSNFCAGATANCTGNAVNSTRGLAFPASYGNVTETKANFVNRTDGGFEQWLTSTSPVDIPSANFTLYSYFQSLTVYANTTANNASTLQIWINACVSNQTAATAALPTVIGYLGTAYTAAVQNFTSTQASASASASSIASSGASSIASASSAGSSLAASATSSLASVASSLSGAAASATSASQKKRNLLKWA